jgi:transcriptional regulator with XRE-family HTH domain
MSGGGEIIKFPDKKARARTEWYRAFGQRLRETRLALGITEAEAAAARLVTLRTYRRHEAGLPHRGKHSGLVSFARKYDLSYNWLLAGAGDKFNTPPAARRRNKLAIVPTSV